MSFIKRRGRLGNQIVMQLAASIIAEKHNLYIEYENCDAIKAVGIKLFVGEVRHDKNVVLTDHNYMDILNADEIDHNISINNSYFQTKLNSDIIHAYLNTSEKRLDVMNRNMYKNRYDNNNDVFVHVRLGDVHRWNPGFEYYDGILKKIPSGTIYVATDTNNHEIIVRLAKKYKNMRLMGPDLGTIFKLGSTCKHVILSYGTFSAMIGYMAYYSRVYYRASDPNYRWDHDAEDECEMFSKYETNVGGWIEVMGGLGD